MSRPPWPSDKYILELRKKTQNIYLEFRFKLVLPNTMKQCVLIVLSAKYEKEFKLNVKYRMYYIKNLNFKYVITFMSSPYIIIVKQCVKICFSDKYEIYIKLDMKYRIHYIQT